MVLCAGSKEQLDADTDQILSLSRQKMCQMAVLKYQQTDGLNTVLPIGTRKINASVPSPLRALPCLCPLRCRKSRTRAVSTLEKMPFPIT